jgi:iron complex outermembrane receptor protein
VGAFAFVALGAALRPSLQAEAALGTAELADLSLEQLMEVRIEKVSGASRDLQRVTRAPAVVSIVGADEIRGFGYRTLADVLRSVRGLYVSNDRNYSYLGSRGFLRPGDYNTRVLLLVDGHRMNDNIFDAAYFGYGGILNLDTVERVEFIRGPSSSIYGSNAFFGVVNVVTKSAEQLEGATISAEAGTGNTFGGSFHAAHRWRNGLELTLAGALHRSDGEDRIYFAEFDERRSDDPRAANQGVAEDLDREEAESVSARLTFRDFTLSGYVSSRSKLVPTASFETAFNARSERTEDRRAYLDLHFAHTTETETLIEAR